jgi:hypothetical protein
VPSSDPETSGILDQLTRPIVREYITEQLLITIMLHVALFLLDTQEVVFQLFSQNLGICLLVYFSSRKERHQTYQITMCPTCRQSYAITIEVRAKILVTYNQHEQTWQSRETLKRKLQERHSR